MKHRTFFTRFFLVASILTAALIFFFSAQQGPDSAAMSDGVTLEVAKVVKPDYERLPTPERQSFLESLELIVRKCAHFGEFALLAFNLTGYLCLKRPEKPRLASAALAWGIAILYAGTDELHQMFVDQRGPALFDVGIDSAGAAVGALIGMLLLQAIVSRKRKS